MSSADRFRQIFVNLALVLVLLIVGAIAFKAWRVQTYYKEQRSARRALEQLLAYRPPNVSSNDWNNARGWAITAYENICFSENLVPLDELKRFKVAVKNRIGGHIGLETIDWVWHRLAETGPAGETYRGNFMPLYLEHTGRGNTEDQ